ncbi:hypothetical protein SESBI_23825 [Sesbania bispinosa]|nr:hypothetical protein SESBI_23825 [Sesbania bispinosa]
MALVSAGFHTVSKICSRKEKWRLKMKVVRVWIMAAVATPNDPFATHMLFVDEEGTNIEAIVQKHHMHRFANVVADGHVYKITNFGVLTKGYYEFLLDYMGIVTAISEEIHLSREKRETRMMLIDLVDETGKIRCAIFGELVDTVIGFLSLPRIGLPVLIIQLARVNLYKGEVGIQNLTNASKLWWNPDIQPALDFNNSLVVHEIEIDVEISIITGASRPASLRDQFLKLYPKKTLGQLHELDEDGSFVVLGTITKVIRDSFWWYWACSCIKAINFSGGMPYCDECQIYVFEMTPRYKIKVAVSDGNDTAHMLMFDSECYTLLVTSCRDLLAKNKVKPSDCYPDDIMKLVGKEFLFRIEGKDYDSYNIDDSFKVNKICFEVSVIREFKDMVEDETPLKICHPHSNAQGSELDVTPHSYGTSAVTPTSPTLAMKHPLEDGEEVPSDSRKRGRARNVKIEKN